MPLTFRAIYAQDGLYDRLLLPHAFDDGDDVDLVAGLMRRHFGEPAERGLLSIAEFGCGTGRVTAALAPYALRLLGMDSSAAMTRAFAERYPSAATMTLDTRVAVAELLDDGLAGSFDLIGAFWSLSYPLMDCLEELTANGITPRTDQQEARADAGRLVQDLLKLLAPQGRLFALFFDSETPEQRLVTRQWERLAPFPGTGRGYTRQILLEELQDAESRGVGTLRFTRHAGTALAADAAAAHSWFETVHLKSHPHLIGNEQVLAEVSDFVSDHLQPNGEVRIPCGVYVIEFTAQGR